MKAMRLIFAGLVATAAIWAADPNGKWTAEMQGRNGNTMTVTINLKADGNKLTGTVSGRRGETDISDGKVDGDNVSFSVIREFNGNQIKQNYAGKLDGDTIHFKITVEGGMGDGRGGHERTVDAKRVTS